MFKPFSPQLLCAYHRRPAPENSVTGPDGVAYSFLAEATDTQSQFSLMKVTAPQNFSPPCHIHQRDDEAVLLLEGELIVYAGDEILALTTGDFVFLPRSIPHTFLVQSAQAQFLVVVSPAPAENYQPLLSPAALELEQTRILLERYGVEVVGE